MNKYVSLDKQSKKAQREYYAKQRRTWGELNPVTRSVPNGKAYNRKKEKQRTGREFSNGFEAGSIYLLIDSTLNTSTTGQKSDQSKTTTGLKLYFKLYN